MKRSFFMLVFRYFPFFNPPPEKMSLIFAFRWLFRGPDGLKYVAETGTVQRPLMAIWRGVNLPYFGKWGAILAYSPLEQKPAILQGCPGMARTGNREKEPDTGLFFLSGESFLEGNRSALPAGQFPVAGVAGSTSDRQGRYGRFFSSTRVCSSPVPDIPPMRRTPVVARESGSCMAHPHGCGELKTLVSYPSILLSVHPHGCGELLQMMSDGERVRSSHGCGYTAFCHSCLLLFSVPPCI